MSGAGSTHTYLLTPLAPLVLRKGKPFGETGGGDSHAFPFPSTVAGTLRAARADAERLDFDQSEIRQTITGWECAGILPALIDREGKPEALFPKPQDALYLGGGDGAKKLVRLSPAALREGEGCDLPPGLWPVFQDGEDSAKPAEGPLWWHRSSLEAWLSGQPPASTIEDLGPKPAPFELRNHVSLDPATLAGRPGLLFQSAGPDWEAARKRHQGWEERRFGLLARCAEKIAPTLVRLGGEGRLSALDEAEGAWPALPARLKALEQERRFRLILCTPALFTHGWRPGWLDKDLKGQWPAVPGLEVRLRAAVFDRWQAISGWDIRARRPKASRRLVPAGAVYWFELLETCKPPPGWVEQLWLQSVCDEPADKRDGFGLALPGCWIDLA